MKLHEGFIRIAHDPGDPMMTAHCPFCGSGQVFGRSDGNIECDFCGQVYIVRVQPAFSGMPQLPEGPGAPSDVGPDGMPMGGMGPDGMPMDPGMDPGMDPDALADPGGGMPPGLEDEEGGPPGGDEEEDGSAPPFGGGDDSPPKKDKSDSKSKSKKKAGKLASVDHEHIRSHHRPLLMELGRDRAVRAHAAEHEHYPLAQDHQHGIERQLHSVDDGWADASYNPGFVARRSAAHDPEYAKHYNRGWASSQRAGHTESYGPSPLERADDKGEPDSWYDGYLDHAGDRPKWHTRDCDSGNHGSDPDCTLVKQGHRTADIHREPLPDNAYWKRMKAGHKMRTGHDLDAILMTGNDGISHVQRYCCDDKPSQFTPEDEGFLGQSGIQAARRKAHINHGEMSGQELRYHMRDSHGFQDSSNEDGDGDPDWVIDEEHRNQHADGPLEDHRHPDLEDEDPLDLHLGDKDWLGQHGIEGSRRYRTIGGDMLPEEAFIRHLAVLHSGGSPEVMAALRHSA